MTERLRILGWSESKKRVRLYFPEGVIRWVNVKNNRIIWQKREYILGRSYAIRTPADGVNANHKGRNL